MQLRWIIHHPLAWLLLVSITIGWGGVLFGRFQYDDFPNILNDPATSIGPLLWERLTDGIRPLSRLTYAMDFTLWGKSPRGWFATNLLIHLVTMVGVWRLARCAAVSHAGAWMAALIFALQPAHGAVVAYVSGRSSALMTALLVWALIAHEYRTRHEANRRRATVLAIGLFLAACAAKEVALVFPLLLLLWEWTKPNPTHTIRTPLQSVVPFMLAALALGAYALTIARYRELLTYSLDLRAPLAALFQNVTALPLTASLLVRPWALSVEHAPPPTSYLAALISTAAIIAWCVIGVAVRPTRPMLTLGLLWPVVALLPTHTFIAKVEAISESPLYLAWIGPAIALGTGVGGWLAANGRDARMRYYCVLLGVGAASALCAWRTITWNEPVRLWQEAVRNASQSSRAWNNLGMAHLSDDNAQFARFAFREALRLNPANMQAQFNLEMTGLFVPAKKIKEKE